MTDTTLNSVIEAIHEKLPASGGNPIVSTLETFVSKASRSISEIVENHPNPVQFLTDNPDLVSRKDLNWLVSMALISATAPSVHAAHAAQYEGREYEIVKDTINLVQAEALDIGEVETMLSDYLEDPTSSDILSITTDLNYAAAELSLSTNRHTGALINQINDLIRHVEKDPNGFQSKVMDQHQSLNPQNSANF